MTSNWIQSRGGPLLLLPSELLQAWGGTDTSDYDRACAVRDEVAQLAVGSSGFGLVLGDEPHQTTWAPSGDGGMLVRWVYADDEADAWAALDSIDESVFDSPERIAFATGESGSCKLIDSADPGYDLQSEHIEVALRRGTYAVQTAVIVPNERTRMLVHRLTRTS